MRIAISGCGITGTAVACFLAKAGHEVTLFEQAEECGPIGAGLLLQPSGQMVLQRMDLLEALEARSEVLDGMTAMLSSGRKLIELKYAWLNQRSLIDERAKGLYGLGVHRGNLFEILFNQCQASGVSIVHSARVVQYFRESSGGIVVQTEIDGQGESYDSFDFLIAADGSRSALREFSQIKTSIIDYDFAAIWTTGQSEFQPGQLYQLVQGTKHLVGLLPIGNGESSYFWGLPTDSFKELRSSNFADWRSKAIEICPQSESLLGQTESFEEFTFARYRHVNMKTYLADRIIFLGDAAHATSPHLGQGVNLGLEDAECFADALTETDDFESACKRFLKQRLAKIRFYQQLTRQLSPFFQSHGHLRALARNMVLPWMPFIPYVRKQMVKTLCGTKNSWFR